jgi:hypothetical protein
VHLASIMLTIMAVKVLEAYRVLAASASGYTALQQCSLLLPISMLMPLYHVGEVPGEATTPANGQLTWPAVAASVQAVLPAAMWDIIPVELYTTFWSMSLYDVHVPTES